MPLQKVGGCLGLFGSIWVNELARVKKANKKGDRKDCIPRLVLYFVVEVSRHFIIVIFLGALPQWSNPPLISCLKSSIQAIDALGEAQPIC